MTISSILEESIINEKISYNSHLIDDPCIDKSYFTKTIEDITSLKEEYNSYVKDLYIALQEDGIDNEESFKLFSDRCKEILDKTNKKIDRDIKNFSFCFKAKYKSDFNNSIKYENNLTNYSGEEFSIEKFDFSNIEKIIPNYKKINPMFTAEIKPMMELVSSDKTFDEMNRSLKKFSDNLSGDFYDIYRGAIMGSKEPIVNGFYGSICFSIFRNGKMEKETVLVNKSIVKDSYASFKKFKEYIKYLEDDSSKAKKEISTLSSELYSLSTNNLSDDGVIVYAAYLKLKSRQLMDMLTYFLLAFSAKMDAVSDMYMQNINILANAITNSNNNLKVGEYNE